MRDNQYDFRIGHFTTHSLLKKQSVLHSASVFTELPWRYCCASEQPVTKHGLHSISSKTHNSQLPSELIIVMFGPVSNLARSSTWLT